MLPEITTNAQRAAGDLVESLTLVQFHLHQASRIILKDVDDAITLHIDSRFKKTSAWEPLSSATLHLRGLRGQRLKGGAAKAARSLWYRKHAPKVGAPQSNRSYGWTRGAERAALAPGQIQGTKSPTLRRRFRSQGAKAAKRLEYWHYGTKTRVTPKQRAFLHRVGIHLRKSTTSLSRPARPIYDEKEITRITTTRFERRLNDLLEALQEGAPGLFGTRVIRR